MSRSIPSIWLRTCRFFPTYKENPGQHHNFSIDTAPTSGTSRSFDLTRSRSSLLSFSCFSFVQLGPCRPESPIEGLNSPKSIWFTRTITPAWPTIMPAWFIFLYHGMQVLWCHVCPSMMITTDEILYNKPDAACEPKVYSSLWSSVAQILQHPLQFRHHCMKKKWQFSAMNNKVKFNPSITVYQIFLIDYVLKVETSIKDMFHHSWCSSWLSESLRKSMQYTGTCFTILMC